MKKQLSRLVCLGVLALLLLMFAAAQEPETAEELKPIQTSGTVDLFQCGSLTGNHTIPGEVSLFGEDEIEARIYQEILQGLTAQQETITVSRNDVAISQENLDAFTELVKSTYGAVVNDNPGLFYTSKYYRASCEGNGIDGLVVTLTPSYRASVTQDQIAAFNQAVAEAKAQVAGVTDPVEILLRLHDYLVIKNAYNWDVDTTGDSDDGLVWSAYAALVQGDPVCQGYALAYKLLLNELGIDCITVTSEAMHHMWNMVRIDGSWYHVDVTWDDPTPNTEGYCGHDYFLLSDGTISAGKYPHYNWEAGLPACTSTAYESGWIFNQTGYPVYPHGGQFFYVDGTYGLHQSSALQAGGTKIAQLSNSYHPGYGILWKDDGVYYVPYSTAQQKTLKTCNLQSGEISTFGQFPFVPTAVSPYAADMDYIGLRIDASGRYLEAVSSTRREMLYSVPLPQRNDALPALAAPTDLRWGVRYDHITKKETPFPGAISWTGVAGTSFEIHIFREGEAEPVLTFWQETRTEGEVCYNDGIFSWNDAKITSGNYYFTVKAMGDGVTCSDSEVVRSAVWTYTKPEARLNTVQPTWGEQGVMRWENQFEGETLVDYYEVNVFYAVEADGEPQYVTSRWIYPEDETPKLRTYEVEKKGSGYYFFTVRAISNDITQARSGATSEPSAPLYVPEASLEVSDPGWGQYGELIWTNGFSDKTLVDHYEIVFYYAETSDAEPMKITTWWSMPEFSDMRLPTHITDRYGDGYYYFTVQAHSNDVTKARPGAVSVRSAAYQYIAPPKLSTPTNLTWGVEYEEVYLPDGTWDIKPVSRPGAMSWKRGEHSQNEYEGDLYRVEENGDSTWIRSFFCRRGSGYAAEWFPMEPLEEWLQESGTYYFTVRAVGDEINYRSSDVAVSPMWEYTKPENELQPPSDLMWDGTKMSWTVPSDPTSFHHYYLEALYCATEDEEPTFIGGWEISLLEQNAIDIKTATWIQHRTGFYSFRIRVISSDITVARSSEWTELCKTYLSFENAADQLENIVKDLDTTDKQEVDQAVGSVKQLDKQELSAAMADKDNTETMELIKTLDDAAKTTGGVTVSVQVDETQTLIAQDKVSIVGAGLNAGSSTVTLKIEPPTPDLTIPELYHDVVQFSMHLDGAEDVDGETGNQELAVPVKITLPIPANINPGFLVIMHHRVSEGEWEQILPHIYYKDNQWYADFVVTSFSDFALVMDSEIPAEAQRTDTGVRVTMSLTTEQTGSAICAVYDKNGKQLGSAILDNLTSGEHTVEIPCSADQAATIKIFLLDEASNPLHIVSCTDVTA